MTDKLVTWIQTQEDLKDVPLDKENLPVLLHQYRKRTGKRIKLTLLQKSDVVKEHNNETAKGRTKE